MDGQSRNQNTHGKDKNELRQIDEFSEKVANDKTLPIRNDVAAVADYNNNNNIKKIKEAVKL